MMLFLGTDSKSESISTVSSTSPSELLSAPNAIDGLLSLRKDIRRKRYISSSREHNTPSLILRSFPPRMEQLESGATYLTEQEQCGNIIYNIERHLMHTSTHIAATATFLLSCSGVGFLRNVHVTLNAPVWVHAAPLDDALSIDCASTTPETLLCTFSARKAIPPSSMRVRAIATYHCPNSQVRYASTQFLLPMALACRIQMVQPAQDALYKFTLDTDKKAVSLFDLFNDMYLLAKAKNKLHATASVVSFQFWYSSYDVSTSKFNFSKKAAGDSNSRELQQSTHAVSGTILVSKLTGRYRLQSTAIPALWLLTHELHTRLRQRWRDEGGLKITYNEQLPLSDYYNAIDHHHGTRVAVRLAESALNDACHQYRIIEKRMLIRFKDSRPAKIDHLDLLMQQTHNNLLQLASMVDIAQEERARSSRILACHTELLLSFMHFRFSFSSQKLVEISSHMNPDIILQNTAVQENSLAGWEETTYASLTFFLKHVCTEKGAIFSLSSKNTNATSHALSFPATTDKLKRRIAILCERLAV